jgi:hypothetical protein
MVGAAARYPAEDIISEGMDDSRATSPESCGKICQRYYVLGATCLTDDTALKDLLWPGYLVQVI